MYYFKEDFRTNKKSKGIGIPQGNVSLYDADIIWDVDRIRTGKHDALMICTPKRTFYIQPQQQVLYISLCLYLYLYFILISIFISDMFLRQRISSSNQWIYVALIYGIENHLILQQWDKYLYNVYDIDIYTSIYHRSYIFTYLIYLLLCCVWCMFDYHSILLFIS